MAYLKILYANINRTDLMEWSLSEPIMVKIVCNREDLIAPKFPQDLYANGVTCFKSYKYGETYLNFVIAPQYAIDFDISEDQHFLKRVIDVDLLDSVINPAISVARDLGVKKR